MKDITDRDTQADRWVRKKNRTEFERRVARRVKEKAWREEVPNERPIERKRMVDRKSSANCNERWPFHSKWNERVISQGHTSIWPTAVTHMENVRMNRKLEARMKGVGVATRMLQMLHQMRGRGRACHYEEIRWLRANAAYETHNDDGERGRNRHSLPPFLEHIMWCAPLSHTPSNLASEHPSR